MAAMKLVRVVWHDASDEPETWIKSSELSEDPVEVCSVGFLVRETALYVTLAGDWSDPTWGRVTRIPRGMVQRMDVLEGGE